MRDRLLLEVEEYMITHPDEKRGIFNDDLIYGISRKTGLSPKKAREYVALIITTNPLLSR